MRLCRSIASLEATTLCFTQRALSASFLHHCCSGRNSVEINLPCAPTVRLEKLNRTKMRFFAQLPVERLPTQTPAVRAAPPLAPSLSSYTTSQPPTLSLGGSTTPVEHQEGEAPTFGAGPLLAPPHPPHPPSRPSATSSTAPRKQPPPLLSKHLARGRTDLLRGEECMVPLPQWGVSCRKGVLLLKGVLLSRGLGSGTPPLATKAGPRRRFRTSGNTRLNLLGGSLRQQTRPPGGL